MNNIAKLILPLSIVVFVLFRIYDKERANGKTGASLAFKIIMTATVALFPLMFLFIGVSMLFLSVNQSDRAMYIVFGLFFAIVGVWFTYLVIKKSKDFDRNFR